MSPFPFFKVQCPPSPFQCPPSPFVTPQIAQQVLDACPDAEWRLIFGLCRFGGLRCPSEHKLLKWADINWGDNRILVHSPKTERFEEKESRLIPLFPELRPYLLERFEQAEDGAEYVIARHRHLSTFRYGVGAIIRKAGLLPWPRLFHNLRSTRQTELEEQFRATVVCAWMGNSEKIARAHYSQGAKEADFDRAAQNAAQQPPADPRKPQPTTPVQVEKPQLLSAVASGREPLQINGPSSCDEWTYRAARNVAARWS